MISFALLTRTELHSKPYVTLPKKRQRQIPCKVTPTPAAARDVGLRVAPRGQRSHPQSDLELNISNSDTAAAHCLCRFKFKSSAEDLPGQYPGSRSMHLVVYDAIAQGAGRGARGSLHVRRPDQWSDGLCPWRAADGAGANSKHKPLCSNLRRRRR